MWQFDDILVDLHELQVRYDKRKKLLNIVPTPADAFTGPEKTENPRCVLSFFSHCHSPLFAYLDPNQASVGEQRLYRQHICNIVNPNPCWANRDIITPVFDWRSIIGTLKL